ncbi:hypothetical protein M0R45_004260 [Rubus argutus]|uniref:UDP-glycosyltransferases domain-containing protein n=1 Tax=Rubus argutus TaxID=59490 RepID=A0AAW1YJA3_RUBAR
MSKWTEMAWGLELSQQRFIWVVRPPTTKSADSAFFTSGNGDGDHSSYLPEGFLTRTRDVGMVVPLWAPQVDILGHPSVGGFFSHCGWNSTLESVTNGVPMIAWPLYAEQRMNATLLTEELGVASGQKFRRGRKWLGGRRYRDGEKIIKMGLKYRVKEKLSGKGFEGRWFVIWCTVSTLQW